MYVKFSRFNLQRTSALETSFRHDPVSIVCHSSVDTRLVWKSTFIAPAYNTSKEPNAFTICTNQRSTRVTLEKKKNVYNYYNLKVNIAYIFSSVINIGRDWRSKKPEYFNIKMILVLNIFVIYNHLFKSNISVCVFGCKIR